MPRLDAITLVTRAATAVAVACALGLLVVHAGRPHPPPAPVAAPAMLDRAARTALAENAGRADAVLDGAITMRLARLRGVPVVVNQWASWCPSCRAEFPLFAQVARGQAGHVAFIGLDAQDARSDAEAFLQRHSVGYPSVFDADGSQALSIGGGRSWPTTIFYDAAGQRTHVRQGGYASLAALRADVERYALGR